MSCFADQVKMFEKDTETIESIDLFTAQRESNFNVSNFLAKKRKKKNLHVNWEENVELHLYWAFDRDMRHWSREQQSSVLLLWMFFKS